MVPESPDSLIKISLRGGYGSGAMNGCPRGYGRPAIRRNCECDRYIFKNGRFSGIQSDKTGIVFGEKHEDSLDER